MRMPISRVRSVTDTSMMFMIPMPPTSSETPAMQASSSVIVLLVWLAASAMSVMLRFLHRRIRCKGNIVLIAALLILAFLRHHSGDAKR